MRQRESRMRQMDERLHWLRNRLRELETRSTALDSYHDDGGRDEDDTSTAYGSEPDQEDNSGTDDEASSTVEVSSESRADISEVHDRCKFCPGLYKWSQGKVRLGALQHRCGKRPQRRPRFGKHNVSFGVPCWRQKSPRAIKRVMLSGWCHLVCAGWGR